MFRAPRTSGTSSDCPVSLKEDSHLSDVLLLGAEDSHSFCIALGVEKLVAPGIG